MRRAVGAAIVAVSAITAWYGWSHHVHLALVAGIIGFTAGVLVYVGKEPQ